MGMVRRTVAAAVLAGLMLGGSADAQKAGEHKGEKKQIDVQVLFSQASGTTLTTADGTYFCVWGSVYFENKIYPAEYCGSYPLYFFGSPVVATVRIKNTGPRAVEKLRVRFESGVLKTDGCRGADLMEPREVDVEIARGQSIDLDGTFVAEATADSESGLNLFVVKVLHPNSGGGPGNAEPALIMVKEAVFCPPALGTVQAGEPASE